MSTRSLKYKNGDLVEVLPPTHLNCGCPDPKYVDKRPPRYNQGPLHAPIQGVIVATWLYAYQVDVSQDESKEDIQIINQDALRYWYPHNKRGPNG